MLLSTAIADSEQQQETPTMSLAFYKVLHLFGFGLLFAGIGGLCALSIAGADSPKARKLASILHGASLVIVLIAGFGLLAKLGIGAAIPLWIWLKILIWLALGAAIVVLKRAPQYAAALFIALPILGAIAGYLAIYKLGSGG